MKNYEIIPQRKPRDVQRILTPGLYLIWRDFGGVGEVRRLGTCRLTLLKVEKEESVGWSLCLVQLNPMHRNPVLRALCDALGYEVGAVTTSWEQGKSLLWLRGHVIIEERLLDLEEAMILFTRLEVGGTGYFLYPINKGGAWPNVLQSTGYTKTQIQWG